MILMIEIERLLYNKYSKKFEKIDSTDKIIALIMEVILDSDTIAVYICFVAYIVLKFDLFVLLLSVLMIPICAAPLLNCTVLRNYDNVNSNSVVSL